MRLNDFRPEKNTQYLLMSNQIAKYKGFCPNSFID